MKTLLSILFFLTLQPLQGKETPVIYLQPNTTQLFSELYERYGILNHPRRTFFESALYLDQSIPPHNVPFQPSNEAIFNRASEILMQFHKKVGDLELYVDPMQAQTAFYIGAGSKHLIVALVYGIVMSEPDKKFVFVEEAPYYSGHPNAVKGIFKYPNARFLTFHDPSEIKLEPGEMLVEFVTSPNNPDGKFRKPVTDAQIVIADFVFASSAFGDGTGYVEKNSAWIKEARAQGKHLFSFNSASKQFGKTGTRIGYLWYPMYDSYAASIFDHFFDFIAGSTVGAGSEGLADFLDLIQAFLNLPDNGNSLRKDAHQSLTQRHRLIERELLHRYPGSSVVSIPGSPTLFAKIKDPRIPQKRAADVLLDDLAVSVNNGEPMGENDEYIRLNLSGYSQSLATFLNRLNPEKKYAKEDVFFASQNICPKVSINSFYIAKPGDCLIEADAQNGPIDVILPPFIDFLDLKPIAVIKTDSSSNSVAIKTENFTRILAKPQEKISVQWSGDHFSVKED